MPFTVRIQNFQSIEDATIVVDGLTVITGPNNSGKTAAMRAVKGVFTNPPAGPLVRNGCNFLIVTIVFGDGSTIVWEKGWEKPDQKGKAINQYTINGKRIETVGRGVPPEIESFGVREIQAASDKIWPQIADQFDGTLFLVNRPGSSIAEALSDVERVGKLSTALKASEKDRRSVQSELKIRRKDLEQSKTALEKYDGLGFVSDQIKSLSKFQDVIDSQGSRIIEVSALKSKYDSALGKSNYLSGFDPGVVPSLDRVEKLKKAVDKVSEYHKKFNSAKLTVGKLSGFDSVSLPNSDESTRLKDELKSVSDLNNKLIKSTNDYSRYSSFSAPDLPEASSATATRQSITSLQLLIERYNKASKDCSDLEKSLRSLATSVSEAEDQVVILLGDRGLCPTCNTVHNGSH